MVVRQEDPSLFDVVLGRKLGIPILVNTFQVKFIFILVFWVSSWALKRRGDPPGVGLGVETSQKVMWGLSRPSTCWSTAKNAKEACPA